MSFFSRFPAVLTLLVVLLPCQAAFAEPSSPAVGSSKFVTCSNQTYALCAVAGCFVMDKVAYCSCDVELGDSISLAFNFDDQNVCSVNQAGVDNGYMVSTFSVPKSVLSGGNQALYTCRAGANGAYAQCDGGLCFTSTEGKLSPGFNNPLSANQIICSCPITLANPAASVGYQIAGPFPCQKSFFKNCSRAVANTKTGSQIYVGAPTGTARALAALLTGSPQKFNQCHP